MSNSAPIFVAKSLNPSEWRNIFHTLRFAETEELVQSCQGGRSGWDGVGATIIEVKQDSGWWNLGLRKVGLILTNLKTKKEGNFFLLSGMDMGKEIGGCQTLKTFPPLSTNGKLIHAWSF